MASTATPKAASTTGSADDVATRLKKLETRTKAVNHNNIARVENSRVVSADDKLNVLHSLKTDKPIEKFPATPKDIAKLGETQIDTMLLALEAEKTGNRQQKIESLRVQIGLEARPA